MSGLSVNNPLLESTTFKPFQHPEFFDAFRLHESMHWQAKEVQLHKDIVDWQKKLTAQEKNLLTHIFRFFTQGDIDVSAAYINYYLPIYKSPEVRLALLSFAAREATHIDAYSYLIETLGFPATTYSQFAAYEAMAKKHDYLLHVPKENEVASRLSRLAVFSGFVEGMQLFSSFAILMSFPQRGLMDGMGQMVDWSIRDETVHTNTMCQLFRKEVEIHPEIWTDDFKRTLYQVARDMVALEDKFVDLAFELGPLPNLTADQTKQYARYIADLRLGNLGLKPMYNIDVCPLKYMEDMLLLPSHVNFFENRPTDYSKGTMVGSWATVWGQYGQHLQ